MGSIGVRGGGFGFPELLGRLDPFLPEQPEDVAFTQTLLDSLHARFKDWVRERRAGRLAVEAVGEAVGEVAGRARLLP